MRHSNWGVADLGVQGFFRGGQIGVRYYRGSILKQINDGERKLFEIIDCNDRWLPCHQQQQQIGKNPFDAS